MSRIGAAIRARRVRSGMYGRELARQTGLSATFVSEIERGTRMPTPETMLKIATVFSDVDTGEWLFLLLRDVWGPDIVALMRRYAVAQEVRP